MSQLIVKGLSKQFGGVKAVQDVSFTIQGGTVHSVIGPNGAGKTTLFNLITGIYTPTSGSIEFEGEAVAGQAPADPEDHAAAAHRVEEGDLLGRPQRVVPGQHDHARAKQDVGVAAGVVTEPLHRVGAHGVVVEVVLDGPQRFESQLHGKVTQAHLLAVHLEVTERVERVLESGGVANVHDRSPWLLRVSLTGRSPRCPSGG